MQEQRVDRPVLPSVQGMFKSATPAKDLWVGQELLKQPLLPARCAPDALAHHTRPPAAAGSQHAVCMTLLPAVQCC